MDLLVFVKAFLVGGAICTIGQVIINFTHLTNGKILVLFLVVGAVLETFGLYGKLVDFAGAGASVPISGFGSSLVRGAIKGAKEGGLIGAIKGGLAETSLGISVAIVSGYLVAIFCKPKTKKR
ncbi:MAG: stage V sporulation protein AE [Clostridia bacterium]|nr:stage V sporulation protein AE [Clostridia bacterium]